MQEVSAIILASNTQNNTTTIKHFKLLVLNQLREETDAT